MSRPPAAIVLAAGKGTRMKSDLPKVLHPADGAPMVRHVVEALRAIGATPIVLVVGHGADLVREAFAGDDGDLRFALQTEQLGTGHAVACGLEAVDPSAGDGDLLVLCGDGPLIRASTLRSLLENHRDSGAAATLATSRVPDPTGYGRIARDEQGRFRAIVEHADADESERAIDEINPSVYAFREVALREILPRVGRGNAKGEVYLTDVFSLLLDEAAAGRIEGPAVGVVAAVPPEEVLSVNTPEQLAEVDRILRTRQAESKA
jgi:bifunctional UDP-N-acetylglucosamine pyrophosphorylase/glucosamine-1-phosphate N-acetyltransferase